ncbi:hypothetical protein NL676_013488 [Syzygium grande]|nr:hypothetical protein NL676_013488 [Syzygium grande]
MTGPRRLWAVQGAQPGGTVGYGGRSSSEEEEPRNGTQKQQPRVIKAQGPHKASGLGFKGPGEGRPEGMLGRYEIPDHQYRGTDRDLDGRTVELRAGTTTAAAPITRPPIADNTPRAG